MYPAMRLVARVSCLTWGEPPDGVSRTGSDGGSAKPGAGHASRGRYRAAIWPPPGSFSWPLSQFAAVVFDPVSAALQGAHEPAAWLAGNATTDPELRLRYRLALEVDGGDQRGDARMLWESIRPVDD